MFPFHSSQVEIKIGKWIFFRIFGVRCHYSAGPCGGMWASHGTEDTDFPIRYE